MAAGVPNLNDNLTKTVTVDGGNGKDIGYDSGSVLFSEADRKQ